MNIRRVMICNLAAMAILLAATSLAQAQATRTWVSGVGDDANPCSRTAPCKTFAGAISKTATGGEIDVLDPGGFGAVTITKSISIEACCIAGVLVSGTNAIVVQAPAGSNIVLRGLTIEGLGTGLTGVKFTGGGSLTVENCFINNFTTFGIDFAPNQAQNSYLSVKDTVIRNCVGASSGGIIVEPVGGGIGTAMINNVRLENNTAGLKSNTASAVVHVSDSVAANNQFAGFASTVAGAVLNLDSVQSLTNGTGLVCNGTLRIGRSHVAGNTTATNNNSCNSYKNNDFDTVVTTVALTTNQ
jgi:hypothetical protein